jgi:hypothetical protein
MSCEAHGCDRPAEVAVFWPGHQTYQCRPHAARASGVAAAMGFALPIVPMTPRLVVEIPPSED